MIILESKSIVTKKLSALKNKISSFKNEIKMTIIQVGNIFESNKYIGIKIKVANEIGIETNHIKLSEKISQNKLIEIIKKECKETDGLIVQLPLPKHLDKQLILNTIEIEKDIDGLSEENHKLLFKNESCIFPATAKAIISLLENYNIEIKNKNIAIIGESNLVGKPTKELLIRKGAIVNTFNKETGIKNSENADILIAAAGSPNLIKAENIKKDAVVIDVGVNEVLGTNKIVGDVDFESIKNKAFAVSPTIGGVGPLTVVSLLENLVEIYDSNLKK